MNNTDKIEVENAKKGSPRKKSVEVRFGSEPRFNDYGLKLDGSRIGPGPAAYSYQFSDRCNYSGSVYKSMDTDRRK